MTRGIVLACRFFWLADQIFLACRFFWLADFSGLQIFLACRFFWLADFSDLQIKRFQSEFKFPFSASVVNLPR
jgi:hypothetical protein